jgi:hypothetical protein
MWNTNCFEHRMESNTKRLFSIVAMISLIHCSSDSESMNPSPNSTSTEVGLDPAHFLAKGLASPITTESCTLSGGTKTTCYRISISGAPADHAVGPFCPRTITDGADAAGIWIESGKTYPVTGQWVTELATFYNDPTWKLFDASTGKVNVTDSMEACSAAARPNVDPAYNNFCVECSLDYVNGGIGATYLLPVTPVALPKSSEIGRMSVVGLALNGVAFDPPAPTQAILAAHTIAAFDKCGGHVNLMAGYHYHAATGCSEKIAQSDKHAGLIGYALDGYGIYEMTDESGVESSDLDECRGHMDSTRGYHYHVAGPGENMFLGCFHGEQGKASQ